DVISRNPVTIQLRYLQTLIEVSNNQSSTIVFPLPIDILQRLMPAVEAGEAAGEALTDATGDAPEPPRLEAALAAARAALDAPTDEPAALDADVTGQPRSRVGHAHGRADPAVPDEPA
ncbi:MAG: hypothetical protein QOD83_4963, partial [Solirubrobacteraceae bacterium]|nr:hypothetical protein [Solirubrobacteraceae bacterium]